MEGKRSASSQWLNTSTSENVSGLAHSVSEVISGLINIGQVPRKLGHLKEMI